MTQNAQLNNHRVDSIQFFCNDVHLLQEHQNTKNHVIGAVTDLVWTSGCEK